MPTSEDYRQMADRSAQLAIGCSAPSVAQALLALGLEYMTLAARLGEPAAMRQDPAGTGHCRAVRRQSIDGAAHQPPFRRRKRRGGVAICAMKRTPRRDPNCDI